MRGRAPRVHPEGALQRRGIATVPPVAPLWAAVQRIVARSGVLTTRSARGAAAALAAALLG
eukprot:13586601-Alexandrium_andersonii.AAC.1